MAAKEKSEALSEEPSRAAGACVLVVLACVVLAAVFAVSITAGTLMVWAVGIRALWRAYRRMSVSSATPPPEAVAPSGDVFAVGEPVVTRVERGPEGVTCTIHVAREEVNGP
ncbi:hypothetical protein T45_01427 [Streptomyces turgidiscabies]|nr:hypothetical protein T45_01427 [Streptomyces turgidiscabies]